MHFQHSLDDKLSNFRIRTEPDVWFDIGKAVMKFLRYLFEFITANFLRLDSS